MRIQVDSLPSAEKTQKKTFNIPAERKKAPFAAMEVDRAEPENVAVDGEVKPVADEGAGDATTSHPDRLRKKNKKYARSNSKEGVANVAPLPKYRSWKNSRRPRNGHGRGLPKKGMSYKTFAPSTSFLT